MISSFLLQNVRSLDFMFIFLFARVFVIFALIVRCDILRSFATDT
jgi:hypothetical protein